MRSVRHFASSAGPVSATEHASYCRCPVNALLMSGRADAAALQKLQCQRPELVLLAVLVVRFAVEAPLLGPDSDAARLISLPPEASIPCNSNGALRARASPMGGHLSVP